MNILGGILMAVFLGAVAGSCCKIEADRPSGWRYVWAPLMIVVIATFAAALIAPRAPWAQGLIGLLVIAGSTAAFGGVVRVIARGRSWAIWASWVTGFLACSVSLIWVLSWLT